MHRIQEKLLKLIQNQNLGEMTLRQIAELVNVPGKPQIVKHHLMRLESAGLIQTNLQERVIKPVKAGFNSLRSEKSIFYSLPIIGAASCGPATAVADEAIQGYLRVSSSMLKRKKQNLYILIAEGSSMNQATVNDKKIEDGDYVIVDSSYQNPKNGDIMVCVIDGLANIKRYVQDKANNRIVLVSESTENHLPIFVNEEDNLVTCGKVVDIIKKVNKK